MRLRTVAASLLLVLSAPFSKANVAEVGAPVPIYTEAELIKLIEQNKHLERVRADMPAGGRYRGAGNEN
ncbi:putative secreted protein [Vibrio vulnificus]|nr:putative secreted protein [Vibrio vulnificus]